MRAVGPEDEKRRHGNAFDVRAVFRLDEIGLRALQRDRLEHVGKINGRGKSASSRDPFRDARHFSDAAALRLRISERDLIGLRESVRYGIDRNLLVNARFGLKREFRMNFAFAALLVRVGVNGYVQYGNARLCAATVLRFIAGDLDPERNKTFE